MLLRISLLGPPQVTIDGQSLVVDTRKAIALLAYLAVVDRPIARESLVELLWPDADPDAGRGALRRTLSVLRSGLRGEWLAVDRRQVRLRRGPGVEIDVVQFRDRAAHGDRAALTEAAELFRGDFLEGFALRDSLPFDEWQLLEAEALRGELATTLRNLAAALRSERDHPRALAAARRLLGLDPLDEPAHRLVMTIHAEAGDRAAALRQFRDCARVLEQELGVEPGAETRELFDRLRTGAADRPPEPGSVPAAPSLVDAPTRDTLESAAILGDEVDPDLVSLVTGTQRAADALEALVDAGWLREPWPGETDDRYRFVDPAARTGLLGELPIARRRALRDRAAAALERHAEQAATEGRHAAAARSFRLALDLGHPGPAELYLALGNAETLAGRYGEALTSYEIGAARATAELVPIFEHRLGALHLRRGAPDLAELHLSAALARSPAAPSGLRARVMADRSLVAVRRGRLADARRLARASTREARAVGDPEGEAQAENVLAMLARRSGDVLAARRHLRRSLEQAGLAADPGARVAALNNLALLERAVGNLEDALGLTEEALRRCTVIGDRHREAALRNHRADLLHALGRRAEAEAEQVRSVVAFAEVGETPGREPEIWKLVDW